jgi:hypothetical protein
MMGTYIDVNVDGATGVNGATLKLTSDTTLNDRHPINTF